MPKSINLDQRNLFETEQQCKERLAQQADILARLVPKQPVQWFPGISNESYDAVVLKANGIKDRIDAVYDEINFMDKQDVADLDALWNSYSFQIDILEMYNPRYICELAEKVESEIQKLVSRLNVLDDEGEDIREDLRRYELLCSQCIMLGGQPS